MRSCSIIRELRIVRGCLDDYRKLARYHYRDSQLGPFAAIFSIKAIGGLARRLGGRAVGVIVYVMPSTGAELRNVATGNFFAGFDRATRLELINKNIRCISRVIIEPRFRSLGLASRLVRETMGELEVPLIEAMAVMGLVNPFFETAGMTGYTAGMSVQCVQMFEAFSVVGIDRGELFYPQKVQRKIDELNHGEFGFIEGQIKRFLGSYGKRRSMPIGIERMEFISGKLTGRPSYYIWFNPEHPRLIT
ncbi:MAG: hypothetical protein KAS75_06985 [Planctomycetes bacterium]|nr:hypothetical protein [Planctomycetota bacterium]